MTGLIPQDIIEQVKERTDIADVVGGYVTLSRAGQNLKGLCPFHAEKTPSFNVSPSRQIFHCFGCGTGGNVFTFVMKLEGSSFPEAVRELAKRAGITVPEIQSGSPDNRQRERLEQVNDAAALWFRRNLEQSEGEQARAYLADRGIMPDTSEAFGIGLAPAGWDGVLRALSS